MTKITLFALTGLLLAGLSSNAQDIWTQKADFPGDARMEAIGFSIGGKGFVGAGYNPQNNNISFYKDFYEFNSNNNTWINRSDIGDSGRFGAISFSIGNNGYVGSGIAEDTGKVSLFHCKNDLWEYDTAKNLWTQKANLPGLPRSNAIALGIGEKAYFGLGAMSATLTMKGRYLNDFWQYDPIKDNWLRKSDFPGLPRTYAIAFANGGKIYIGTGADSNLNKLNDFWEYDTAFDSWSQISSPISLGRYGGIGFSIAGIGYIGFGYVENQGISNDLWIYDTSSKQWTQMTNNVSYFSANPVAFSIGNYAYVGTGIGMRFFQTAFWQYTPDHTSNIEEPENQICISIYPNPSTGKFTINSSEVIQEYMITDINGRLIYESNGFIHNNEINVNFTISDGLYFVKVISNQGIAVNKLLISGN